MATPAAEVAVDEQLVLDLLRSQHPDLADRPLHPVEAGWDNAMFRLGDDLAVRLPRRHLAAPLVEHEQRWLPELARQLPLDVPAPLRTGVPGEGFPWRWSIVPWFDGEPADLRPPATSAAPAMGAFLRALHHAAPPEAPVNAFRGVPLAARGDTFEQRSAGLAAAGIDHQAARRAWEEGLAAPLHTGPPVWVHGDLHPRNVLVVAGDIVAVIDWGDLTAGDPATDLATAWMLFPVEAHGSLLDAYGGADPALWARARAWAAFFALILFETGLADDPRFAAVGRTTLERLEP